MTTHFLDHLAAFNAEAARVPIDEAIAAAREFEASAWALVTDANYEDHGNNRRWGAAVVRFASLCIAKARGETHVDPAS